MVQTDAPELRADAGALQIRVGPGVNVSAEHADAHKRNLDCAVHRGLMCIAREKCRQSKSRVYELCTLNPRLAPYALRG